MNIGEVAMEAILAGESDEEALTAVLKAFPDASTKIASIKWYRSKLRRDVKDGKREAGKEGAPLRRTGGLMPDREMTDETKVLLAENRVTSRDKLHVKHMERQEAREKEMGAARQWRRNTLDRYVARVLSLKGAERLAFFEAHPLSEIFR